MSLFSEYIRSASSRKHTERIDNAHVVRLMYKLVSSGDNSNDLSIQFDGSNQRRKQKLTDKKTAPMKAMEGRLHSKSCLKDVFGFAEHQQDGIWPRMKTNE